MQPKYLYSALIKKTISAFAFAGCLCSASSTYGQFNMDIGFSGLSSSNQSKYFLDQVPDNYLPGMVGDTSIYAYEFTAEGVGFTFYPKYELFDFAKHSISIGAPLTFGLSGPTSTKAGTFFSDVNIAVDIVGGTFSDRVESKFPFGYYAGIGFGRTKARAFGYELKHNVVVPPGTEMVPINRMEDDPIDFLNSKHSGIMIHGAIGRVTIFDRFAPVIAGLGIRVSHRLALNKDKVSYTMVTLFADL